MVTITKGYGSVDNLKVWSDSRKKLKLCAIKQILYSNGHVTHESMFENECWFALQLTDGMDKLYVDIEVNNEFEVGDNILKTSNMVEFFKTLLYVHEF